jgi:hypothetical protein
MITGMGAALGTGWQAAPAVVKCAARKAIKTTMDSHEQNQSRSLHHQA